MQNYRNIVPWGKERAGQPLIVSNLITLSSGDVPCAAAMVSLFSSPLLVPCGVPALCPWISALSVSSCPLLLDGLRLTITMVGREHMENKEMLPNLLGWEWEHCPCINLLLLQGEPLLQVALWVLALQCWCAMHRVNPRPWMHRWVPQGSLPPPCDSHSMGKEGKRGAGDVSNQKGN